MQQTAAVKFDEQVVRDKAGNIRTEKIRLFWYQKPIPLPPKSRHADDAGSYNPSAARASAKDTPSTVASDVTFKPRDRTAELKRMMYQFPPPSVPNRGFASLPLSTRWTSL
eukprot:TRINITY_DN11802_c0_g1_i1.p1 TRINITY_DN11802_c0_g1~~TRINITY_DN11802_c0_g1_i1.p1  ORF type:complete len:124 (-),score=7.84 TRINITY_DN11802_c0_g1_i1:193-525(-)